ncbi:MAG: hypothetical protein WBZ11_09720 [Candidatus Sulfotelmatobacter sp.]|jgi:hypothetical protein
MFARKIRVEYRNTEEAMKHPGPLKWTDNFAMRNFTNASVFDDTLPLAGSDWFRRTNYMTNDPKLILDELG